MSMPMLFAPPRPRALPLSSVVCPGRLQRLSCLVAISPVVPCESLCGRRGQAALLVGSSFCRSLLSCGACVSTGIFSVGSLNLILFISGSRLTRGPRWIRLVPQQSCCPHTQDLPSSQRVGLRDRVGVALARLRATSSGTAIVSPAAGRLPTSSAFTVYVSLFRWTRAHPHTHSGRAERDRASAPRKERLAGEWQAGMWPLGIET